MGACRQEGGQGSAGSQRVPREVWGRLQGGKGALRTSRGGSSGAEGMASAKARRLVWLEGRGGQGGAGPKYRAVPFSPGQGGCGECGGGGCAEAQEPVQVLKGTLRLLVKSRGDTGRSRQVH